MALITCKHCGKEHPEEPVTARSSRQKAYPTGDHAASRAPPGPPDATEASATSPLPLQECISQERQQQDQGPNLP